MQVDHVVASRNLLGEGPLWSSRDDRLYWVDIERGTVHTYQPGSGAHHQFHLGKAIGCLGLREAGGFVLAMEHGFALWNPPDKELNVLTTVGIDHPNSRFNDGAVDPLGNFWAGMMTETGADSSLYRLDPDHTVHRMERGIRISNGIGWSPEGETMYFTDSPLHMIYAYDFDGRHGTISNRRVFVHDPTEPGVPDGLCVDQEGNIWSSRWDGWKVICYDPRGKKIDEIRLSVQRPTSCTLGGPGLKTLFITSARTGLGEQELDEQPRAGDLFQVEVDVPGKPEAAFRG